MMEFNTKAVTNVLVDAVCELARLGGDVALALACDVVVVDDLVRGLSKLELDSEEWKTYIWDDG
jgi:hypothetical protein